MLADGEVTMTTAANGRIFNAQELEGQPFIILWDSQILYTSGYGIVEGTRNLEAARSSFSGIRQPGGVHGQPSPGTSPTARRAVPPCP